MDERDEREERQRNEDLSYIFKEHVAVYKAAARALASMGYGNLLRRIRKLNQKGSFDDIAEHEKWIAENYDADEIVDAINQGMTLGEYLEFDSADWWLRAQREGGTT